MWEIRFEGLFISSRIDLLASLTKHTIVSRQLYVAHVTQL